MVVVCSAGVLLLVGCHGTPAADRRLPPNVVSDGTADTDKDPTRSAPAKDIRGARRGGTITVDLPGDPGPADLDPADAWSATGNAIEQDLVSRSLTTFARDPATGNMVLVPDLASDLGTPNADFTAWRFTIRDGVRWQDGSPVTARQVCFGISRTMDSGRFPDGPGTAYSQTYFSGAGTYQGPYSDPTTTWDGCTVDGSTITITMARSFPDMDYFGSLAGMGPVPLGRASRPPAYGQKPLATGAYRVRSFEPGKRLVLVKNDQWDPNSDPARHQYVDRWIFRFNRDPERTDRVVLGDDPASATVLSTGLQSKDYVRAQRRLGDRLIQQAAQCTDFLAPDTTKITNVDVRRALGYAYPYERVWRASGEVPGVTQVPANSIMPPGMVGKVDHFPDGQQFTYQPRQAQALLAQAGYAIKPYPITMRFDDADPTARAVQRLITEAFDRSGFRVRAIAVGNAYQSWRSSEKRLNLRQTSWCADWPTGLTMLPPLLETGQPYNAERFSEPAVDARMRAIQSLPLTQQPAAWGALDEEIERTYLPLIPIAYRNDLFAFGARIGNPSGDGEIGAPDYKDLYVVP